MQLWPAIATARPEHVARQAFAVHAHQHVGSARHLPAHQCQVMLTVEFRPVEVQIKFSVFRRHPDYLDSLHQLFARAPEMD